MQVFSKITKRYYSDTDSVYIVNPQQAWAYINAGAILYDLSLRDDKRIVFVFNRNETNEMYHRWCDRDL